MNILHVCNRFSPAIGGVETHILNLSKKCVANGDSVHVVCSNMVGTNSNERFLDTEGTIEGISYERFKSFRVLGVDATTCIPYLPIYLFQNAKKYDVVHVHSYGYFTSWASILVCKILGKKTIYNPYYADETVLPDIVKKVFDFLFAGWSFRMAAHVIALTNVERDILIRKFHIKPENISVVPTGIDIHEYDTIPLSESEKKEVLERNGISNNNKNIIVIARIAKNKGHIHLLQAFEKMAGCNLIIIGKDWGEKEHLESYRDEHKIDNVYFLEHIDNTEKNKILQASDVFVLSSLGGESFGIVLLEAMANGIPVVASNVGGISDIIVSGENGYLAEAGNSSDIQEKIETIFKTKDIERMKTYCRHFVFQYDWYKIYEQVYALYQRIA